MVVGKIGGGEWGGKEDVVGVVEEEECVCGGEQFEDK